MEKVTLINNHDELIKQIAWFEWEMARKKEDRYPELETKRRKFVKDFTPEVIRNMTTDDYCYWKRNDNTFCGILKDLEGLGRTSVIAVQPDSYGVYVKNNVVKVANNYYSERFGDDPSTALEGIIEEILKLLEYGKEENYSKIGGIRLKKNFRDKLLSVFYPDLYMPMHGYDYTKTRLEDVGINVIEDSDGGLLGAKRELMKWRDKTPEIADWDNHKLMTFCIDLPDKIGKTAPNEVAAKIENAHKIKKQLKERITKTELQEDVVLQDALNRFDDSDVEVFKRDLPYPKKESQIKDGQTYYPRDPKMSRVARKMASYKCEIDGNHETFISKANGKPYMETHHLIPMAFSDQFDASLDVPANIVCLCSNCHNLIHYGKDAKQAVLLLAMQRLSRLKDAGLETSLEDILAMYGF